MRRSPPSSKQQSWPSEEARRHRDVAVQSVVIQGDIVVLREPDEADLAARRRAGRDPEVELGYGFRADAKALLTDAEARAWLGHLRAQAWAWVIVHDDEPVGQLFLHRLDEARGEAFVALGLLRSDQFGHGYGTDALRAVMRWCAGEPLKLRRLRLRVAEHNLRARRCYAKCGFVATGREQRAFELDGHWVDDIVMAASL